MSQAPDAMPHPITFVSRHVEDWSDLIEEEPSPDQIAPRIAAVGGAGGWVLQTYLFLRRRGVPVEISRSMPAEGICILHADDIGIRIYPLRAFVVVIRPDRAQCLLCDMQIVQNPRLVESDRDLFVPYWPQPGLLRRDSSRGTRIERIGFLGRMRNLAEQLRTTEFREKLAAIGMEFVIREDRWWDYSDLDVVLAVRDGRRSFMDAKPASKLVNAWLAGCPALLGRESAFEALRRSDLDYLSVNSMDSVLTALETLKADRQLYSRMIENGFERGSEFNAERNTDRWVALLEGPVRESFETWSKESQLRHLARFLLRCARDRLVVESYER